MPTLNKDGMMKERGQPRKCIEHKHPVDELANAIDIYTDVPNPGAGNGVHHYTAFNGDKTVAEIQFQHGPRGEEGSVAGMTDSALMGILIDRFKAFQAGPFACRENALVLTKLEEAKHWNESRMLERYKRGVLGKNEK